MSSWLRVAFVAVVLVLASQGQAGLAQQDDMYLPRDGDEVVVYVHKFKAKDYHEGRDLVVKGFGAAMQASGQTRRTYFLANPGTHEVVAVSFFHSEASVDEWHDFAGRFEVLHRLEALRREPLELQRYRLIAVHGAQ